MTWYMIAYPCGDRSRLCIAHVGEYERSDYALASDKRFEYTPVGKEECQEYMIELAEKHKLDYEGKRYLLD